VNMLTVVCLLKSPAINASGRTMDCCGTQSRICATDLDFQRLGHGFPHIRHMADDVFAVSKCLAVVVRLSGNSRRAPSPHS
jgi:hypothetical protein